MTRNFIGILERVDAATDSCDSATELSNVVGFVVDKKFEFLPVKVGFSMNDTWVRKQHDLVE